MNRIKHKHKHKHEHSCLVGSVGTLTIYSLFQSFTISDLCENSEVTVIYKKNSIFAKFLHALEIAGICSGNEICYIVDNDSTIFAIGSAGTNLWICLRDLSVSGLSDIL